MSPTDERRNGAPAPLSEQLGLSETIVEIGMTHPGVRRVLAPAGATIGFVVSLDDERITDLEVDIGLGHRGFEKEVESRSWFRALPYVSRLGLMGGLIADVAYCMGIEALAEIALPDRALWLRTLGCELARIADHFARLSGVAAAIELPAAELQAREGAVRAADLLETSTGFGPLGGWVCPGGVAGALSEDFGERWPGDRKQLEQTLARFEAVGTRNPSCVRRLRDVAPLSSDECLAWSVTGPSLRAAGMPADLRRDEPYLAYGSVDFDVPIGEHGDDHDRLLVVVEEIRQSLRIVDQCESVLAGLGPGPLRSPEPGWDGADAGSEELDGPSLPAGDVTVAVEASTGELGFLLVSDGVGWPRRIRCRAPSFFHAQALPAMLRGAQLGDLLPTAALMHLVSGECDR